MAYACGPEVKITRILAVDIMSTYHYKAHKSHTHTYAHTHTHTHTNTYTHIHKQCMTEEHTKMMHSHMHLLT